MIIVNDQVVGDDRVKRLGFRGRYGSLMPIIKNEGKTIQSDFCMDSFVLEARHTKTNVVLSSYELIDGRLVACVPIEGHEKWFMSTVRYTELIQWLKDEGNAAMPAVKIVD